MKGKSIIILTLAVLVAAAIGTTALVLTSTGQKAPSADSAQCANNMVAIDLAARSWAKDHGGHFPPDFSSMSNMLTTPGLLICPGDHARQPAANWASFTPEQCSYEIVARSLKEGNTNGVFLRCKIHGHIGYTDGTVFDGVTRRTKL